MIIKENIGYWKLQLCSFAVIVYKLRNCVQHMDKRDIRPSSRIAHNSSVSIPQICLRIPYVTPSLIHAARGQGGGGGISLLHRYSVICTRAGLYHGTILFGTPTHDIYDPA